MLEFPIFQPYNSTPIELPLSKSIVSRYLTLSYYCGTIGECAEFTDCEDLEVIEKALLHLDKARTDAEPVEIDLKASGTALRFVTVAAASTPGVEVTLTGIDRLMERPMTPLLDVLRAAGASIEPLGENGCGPYRIKGRRLRGGEYEIRGDISSQFISALLMAGPTWEGGLKLRFTTPLVSRPYIEMTIRVMESFGIAPTLTEESVSVEQGGYVKPDRFDFEPDWSAAAFFYEAAAFVQYHHPIKIAHLRSPEKSLQGDAAADELFCRAAGMRSKFDEEEALVGRWDYIPDEINADLSHTPDLVPALAVACVFNTVRFRFTGVRNLRLKESDRLEALKTEFNRYGYPVKVGDDYIEWRGGAWGRDKDHVIETYGDHRIAMAFAIGALSKGSIRIADPDVVNKSFSRFWEQLPLIGLRCTREGDVMIVEKERKGFWE